MKKLSIISLLLTVCMGIPFAAGCGTTPETTDTAAPEVTDTAPAESATEPVTTEEETYDPALDISALEKDEDGNVPVKKIDPGLLVGVDGLGRVLLTNAEVGDVREDRTVGIFYSSWHGTFAEDGYVAVNNQEILDKYPDIDVNNYNDKRWSTAHYHFWNEPIYGYYSGNDTWVIRKQAELLADAG
ncbi:MAG: hypothetical protein J5585_02720, partial [Clostridia bacterium]|nr:hypothetical protein [Clostridia bacterium]